MFFIKIKLKGYLKNITKNTTENIDVFAIKNKNNISYLINNTTHKITILEDKIILIRDNKEFSHQLIFEIDKEHKTEYYIKELNTSIEISLKTIKINKDKNKLEIQYKIIDSNEEYLYLIEMSE